MQCNLWFHIQNLVMAPSNKDKKEKKVKDDKKGKDGKKDKKAKKVEMDYSGLSKGMRLQADGGDGAYYAAEVVEVTESKKRAKAPVKVHFVGYDASWDSWLGADGLRSKAIKPKESPKTNMSCCPPGAAPYLAADHKDEGRTGVAKKDGLEVSFYQVGSGEAGLLICPDIWGWNGGRTRALADDFAKKGLSVWVPKVLPAYQGGTDDDALPPDFDVSTRMPELPPLIQGEWNPSKVVPKVKAVITGENGMEASGVKRFAVIGVCFGGWIGMKIAEDPGLPMVCGTSPHPSMHMEGMIGGEPGPLAGKSSCPWALYPCGVAGADGADPDIYDYPSGSVFKALDAKFPRKNRVKRFDKMAHGFFTRGNIKESDFNAGRGDDVKNAVQECAEDIMRFFDKNGLIKPARPERRFANRWFRKYDKAEGGYVDSNGFMNRLPLRLMATNVVIHGLVDADKMWKGGGFDDEPFQPVLVAGKAVLTIFLNNFIDTDCGGDYLETWYNTVVTPTGTDQVKFDTPDKLGDALAAGCNYLMKVVCSDTPGNPGAANKAICGGRGMFGFPKHPVPGKIRFDYKEDNTKVEFDMEHGGKGGFEVRVKLPGVKKDGLRYPHQEIDALRVNLNLKIPPEGIISSPALGGTHKGHNGANQVRFAQHMCCTQHMAPWDPETDSFKWGTDEHYSVPAAKWDFTPALKVHIPDFKICAFKPSNWITGAAADKAVKEHEKKLRDGVLPGAI